MEEDSRLPLPCPALTLREDRVQFSLLQGLLQVGRIRLHEI